MVMGPRVLPALAIDRKSTRLNSSHLRISYAVFCLKKKRVHHPIPVNATARVLRHLLAFLINLRASRLATGAVLAHVVAVEHVDRAFLSFFNDPATTEIYSLSQHHPLPI